jgi:hypothetical protein
MQYRGSALRAALRVAACSVIFAAGATLASPSFSAESTDVQQLLRWVHASHDAKGLPFAVVDKRNAKLYVFHRDGKLAGSTSALLGATTGDFIAPGVGERAQHGQVRDDERTTPAGRFVSEPGRNTSGEHVIWVDYDSAFAIHRLRPGRSHAAREVRLESPKAADHRVSLGCVVVPVAFYRKVVEGVLGKSRAVVYVLPETRSMAEVFGGA